jgi:hypothetical protein
MNNNEPIFIDIPESDKPLSFVAELAISALELCGFVIIVSVAFTFRG